MTQQKWSIYPAAPVLRGKVVEARGVLVRVVGVSICVGEQVRFIHPGTHEVQYGEVVGIVENGALVMPLGGLVGLSHITQVESCGSIDTGFDAAALLGRVIDGLGQPLDGGAAPARTANRKSSDSINPLERPIIDTPFVTGVRAIDGLLACGAGQRVGIFAQAGGGKSTIMGMIARGASADAVVVALIGERGREVAEFIEDHLQERRASTIVVAATSDRPAAERIKAAELACELASGLRAAGLNVVLLFDSLTRYARALREVGLAIGEPPTRRGYPPSVFAQMPRLIEMAGLTREGGVTAFYTILAEDDDMSDPVAEEARSLLDGHIVLSSRLGAAGHYPAIDILGSKSRLMNRVASPLHRACADRVRGWLAKYRDVELLLQIGEYQQGADAQTDRAVERHGAIESFLRQPTQRYSSAGETLAQLRGLCGDGES